MAPNKRLMKDLSEDQGCQIISPEKKKQQKGVVCVCYWRKLCFSFSLNKGIQRPGARFSKLPVITGPVKLFCFPFQIGVLKLLKVMQ